MYQLILNPSGVVSTSVIQRIPDNAIIPFAPANTDYANFKKDLANGVQLSDANNNIMTANQITTFIATLP
jgi:hypothetical protein